MAGIAQPIIATIDIQHGLVANPQRTVLMQGDANANRMIAKIYDGKTPLDLSGASASGRFIRSDGVEVPLTGVIEGNEASALFNEHCYAVDGYYEARLKLTAGDEARTVLLITGTVRSKGNTSVLDGESMQPDIGGILDLYEEMKNATTDARSAANTALSAAQEALDAAEEAREAAGSVGSGSGTGGGTVTAVRLNGTTHRPDSSGVVDLGSVSAGGPSEEDSIPNYWKTHLDARVADIRAAMSLAGWEKSAFLWYHDIHWTYGYKRAPMLLKYLCEHTPINRTNFGGDVIDAEGDDRTTMAYLWDWRAEVRDLPNHHSVPGNHDDGNTIDNRFDDPYIYAYLLAAEETPEVVRGDSGLYYSIDVPVEKTRYLYLDTATADGNILNDTAEQSWLKQALLSTPEGWHIVAIAHIWRTYDSSFVDNAWGYGAKIALDMFDAYNARTGEFSAGKGRVEFCIGGHTHVDADHYTTGGIPVILTEGDSRYVRSGLDCIEGTITEASVNAIVADYANGKVNVIRVGRGSSRVVMLDDRDTPEEPDGGDEGGDNTPDVPPVNYTNQLPISTDTDGSIYNGKGFKENTRISTSSQTETSATGWCLTGCIRAGRNDVIRMKNVTFMDINNEATTDRTQVYYYDANRAYYNNSNVYSPDSPMNAEWSPVFGDNGDIVQFTIPATFDGNVVYIRICAKHIDASSVITVNEEID